MGAYARFIHTTDFCRRLVNRLIFTRISQVIPVSVPIWRWNGENENAEIPTVCSAVLFFLPLCYFPGVDLTW